MATYPLPMPEKIASVMTDVIGKDVKVKEGDPPLLKPDSSVALVVFRNDQGSPGAAIICDYSFAAFAGAALALMPLEEAKNAIKNSNLPDTLYENFKEIINILGGTLFNSSESPHLVLREVWLSPEKLLSELKLILTKPEGRLNLDVSVDAYGDGKISLLTASE